MTKIETLKADLEWQLTFEEMDWDHFIGTARQARDAQQDALDAA